MIGHGIFIFFRVIEPERFHFFFNFQTDSVVDIHTFLTWRASSTTSGLSVCSEQHLGSSWKLKALLNGALVFVGMYFFFLFFKLIVGLFPLVVNIEALIRKFLLCLNVCLKLSKVNLIFCLNIIAQTFENKHFQLCCAVWMDTPLYLTMTYSLNIISVF